MYEAAVMREIKRRGWSTAKMTNAQYREVGLAARTFPKKVAAVAAVSVTKLRVKAGIVVPLDVLNERRGQCARNECGVHVAEPVEACLSCACSGPDLDDKRKDPMSSCPKKLWVRYEPNRQ